MMGSIEYPGGNLIIEETQAKSKVALLVDNRVLNASDGEQIGVKHSQNSPLGNGNLSLGPHKSAVIHADHPNSPDKTVSVAKTTQTDVSSNRIEGA
jgi:hypothetical protein